MKRIRIVCDHQAHPKPIRLAVFTLEHAPGVGWYPATWGGRGITVETASDDGPAVSMDDLQSRSRALDAGLPDPAPNIGTTYARWVIACPACRREFAAQAHETMGALWPRLAEHDGNVASLSDLSRMVRT